MNPKEGVPIPKEGDLTCMISSIWKESLYNHDNTIKGILTFIMKIPPPPPNWKSCQRFHKIYPIENNCVYSIGILYFLCHIICIENQLKEPAVRATGVYLLSPYPKGLPTVGLPSSPLKV